MASASRRHRQALRGDLPQDADGQARPREGVAPDEAVRQLQFLSHLPHLVLEELPEGLQQLEGHGPGQAADVVVRLDGGRRALEGNALDDVGVEGPLGQEFDAADLLGFVGKEADEFVADASCASPPGPGCP